MSTVFLTEVLKKSSDKFVVGELHTRLALSDVLDVEENWSPARMALRRSLLGADVPRNSWPEHLHWDWAQKLTKPGAPDLSDPLCEARLMGVKVAGHWQGLILMNLLRASTRLEPTGRSLPYVSFLESAPWNQPVKEIGQDPEYGRIGTNLIELAVRLSVADGHKGRLGLHSLPRSRPFYEICGMQNLGPDPSCQNLDYFELTEHEATAHFTTTQEKGNT